MATGSNEPVITVDGAGLEIGEVLPDRVREGVKKVSGKYLGNLSGAAAYFSREAHSYRCRLNLQMAGHGVISAEGDGDDAYKAFGEALERAGKQLRRLKRRLVDERNDPPRPGKLLPA